MSPARRPTLAVLLALVVAALFAAFPALAQTSTPAASASAAPLVPPPLDPGTIDSPRASMKRYLALCRAGEYGEAATYLDVPENRKAEAPALARKLIAVLDRQIWVKLEDLSPLAFGNQSDKLPIGVEEIGSVPGRDGPDPVRLVRRHAADGMRWIFSQATVDKVDEWYGRLGDRWLREYLPEVLLRTGPRELLWWQWIALPLLFACALGLGHVLAYVTRVALGRVAVRTSAQWDDLLLVRIGAPLTLAWGLLVVYLALPWVALYPPAEAFVHRVLRACFFVVVFWFVLRSIDVARERILSGEPTHQNAASRSLVPLISKALKTAVVAMAVIAVLSELGYPVASLIAGLGIGGVALALAAQKTVENLFGSLSIGIDQPFRIGDSIAVDGVSGTVESIGLRSTRIRTADRTLVTMPNGKLADMRIESFAERDRIRFVCVLELARTTSAAQVRDVIDRASAVLREDAKVWPDISVALVRLGDSSLDVEVAAWFATADFAEFQRLRQRTLLELLEIVERAGTTLAMPTRRLYLDTPLAPPPA